MKIAVVGSGYVGLVTGACFAESGNIVACVDNDPKKIASLEKGEVPFYEPGLSEMVTRNIERGRLSFTGDLDASVKASAIVFIAVGTPPSADGSADLSSVFAVARGIAQAMNGYKIVVTKSTVPVGTSHRVAQLILENTTHEFDMVNCPEFLKEGAALNDFQKPDRIVVGASSENAFSIMRKLFSPFVRTGAPVMEMDILSSEMTKYVSNCMLATRISFMNEMANICDKVGADIQMVRKAVGADSRIGNSFLFPGVGFGGSCFPKDLEALAATARENRIDAHVLNATIMVNHKQKEILFPQILKHFGGQVKGRVFAIWGLAFKPKTDDMRDAPSIRIINKLLEMGAKVVAHDPEAMETAKEVFGDRIEYVKRNYEALPGADALIIVTEWNLYRSLDVDVLKSSMKTPVVFDGRDILDPVSMKDSGVRYYCIGRSGLTS